MAPPIKKRGSILAKTNYPVYTVNALGSRHFLLGGGGGKAKTGVPNVLEVYAIDGSTSASKVATIDMGTNAVMRCAILGEGQYHTIAIEQDDSSIQLYNLIIKAKPPRAPQVPTPKESQGSNDNDKSGAGKADELRRRRMPLGRDERTSSGGEGGTSATTVGPDRLDTDFGAYGVDNEPASPWQVSFEPAQLLQTRFPSADHYHKVVRFSPDGSCLMSGGSDGTIRVWKVPIIEKVREIKAHEHQVDDISLDIDGQQMVSVCRDEGQCVVWEAKSGKSLAKLQWAPEGSTAEYRFRQCRFAPVELDLDQRRRRPRSSLYSINVPAPKKAKDRGAASQCYVVKWDTVRFYSTMAVPAGTEPLSELAVSDDGNFLSVGTMGGSVSIYVAFNLKRVMHVAASHGIFVTGLSHLPCGASTRRVTGLYDTSLLSISADNQVKLYHVPVRSTVGLTTVLLLFAFSVLVAYVILDYIGL